MSTPPAPPRLFVIFAKEARKAVIFRRGPTAWYHIIRWNTDDDTFERGAWLKGRIYPEKCDLSPDGKLLLYFVYQGYKLSTSYTDAWTAISHTPWLKAIGLWPQGTTHDGGGRFTDNRSAVINAYAKEPHPDHPAIGLNISLGRIHRHASSNEVDGAEWSGRDQRDRVIYTLDGRLMRRKGKADDTCLADFNGYTPDPQPAPAWAGKPLAPLKRKRKPSPRKK